MCIIFGIFFGDLWVKNRIEQGDMPASLCKNRILLKRYHNTGAMLNLGQHRRNAVAALSVVLCVIMAIVFLFSLGTKGNNLLRIGLSLLLGGSFSNTYDRLQRKYVVDYFSFNVKCRGIRRIVFNLSDFCIMIGALLVVLGTP